jgi:hypothetical protein
LINNRQAGRRRGRNNNPRQNGGGNRGNGDSGNRIDNRARGNAAQLLEKYRNMARDAQLAGDRVNAEYYLQFADHYFRVLADNRSRQEEQQQRFQRNDEPVGDHYDSSGDDGYDAMDEGDDGSLGQGESQSNGRDYQGRRNEPRSDEGGRDQQPRRQEGRNDEGRNRSQDRNRDRDNRGNREDRGNRDDRGERRPRFANDAGANDDSGEEGTIPLAALPPAIGRIEAEPDNDEALPETVEVAAKPRRGRRPRPAEAAE